MSWSSGLGKSGFEQGEVSRSMREEWFRVQGPGLYKRGVERGIACRRRLVYATSHSPEKPPSN